MSLAQRMHFLQDVDQMTATALISVINHHHINRLHLFWDNLYFSSHKRYANKMVNHREGGL